MNRRQWMRSSARVGLAAALGSIGGCRRGRASSTSTPLTPAAAPLVPRPGGSMPAAFVIGADAEVLDFAGPFEVFAGAISPDGSPLFAPYTIASSASPVSVGGGMRIVPDHTFADAPTAAVVVIPAMGMAAADDAMLRWIEQASAHADLTMSVCNGGFVLAKTGLLDGRRATVHHGAYFTFAATFPAVELRRGARFVEDGALATAGGVSSGIDLALRVVDRYVGQDGAAALADAIEYQGPGWRDPDANAAYAKLPPLTGTPPLCPVCLATVDGSLHAVHRGVRYSFCSAGCLASFQRHSDVFDRFLAEDATRT